LANYEQGIATRIHYLRLSEEDSEKVKVESARLGIPMAELFRRMLDLYFDVLSAVPASTSPTLTPRQAETLLASTSGAGKQQNEDDKKFDFTGGEK
jgi:hypothetical protein